LFVSIGGNKRSAEAIVASPLPEIALVIVPIDHIASVIVNADHGISGKRSRSSRKGASRGMYKSISKKELRKLAKNQAQETTEEEAPLEHRAKLKG
jgi:uncharacterized protein DUF3008